MNYGKKFLHILTAAAGMMICIIGIAYRTGYFQGNSGAGALLLMLAGAVIAVWGIRKMIKD